MKNILIIILVLMCVAPNPLRGASVTISNVEPRRDSQGDILDAHDGCLEYFEGRFYFYGTRYTKTDGFGKENRCVCYSSPDLTTWTAHGELIKDAPPRTYYRPYVKHNKRSGKYVMWYNADNQYGVAVADRPAGPFTVSNPNVQVKYSGRGIGDMGLFVDDDGTGYLAYTVGVGGDFGVKVEPIPHHQDIVKSGPLFTGYQVADRGIAVHFDYADGGLASRDGKPLSWFEIAGPDGVYHPAKATISADGTSLLLTSVKVAKPDRARFAWSSVAEPNLMNRAELPAAAFNTHWPKNLKPGKRP